MKKAWFLVLGLAPLATYVTAEDQPKAITPDAAAKMIHAQVVVEMEVKSDGDR